MFLAAGEVGIDTRAEPSLQQPAVQQQQGQRHGERAAPAAKQCTLFADTRGGELPPQRHVEKQPRQEKEDQDQQGEEEEHHPQQPPRRQCLQCASTTKGSAKWAKWHRHPATGQEWLCEACFSKARTAVMRQQRQAEQPPQPEQEEQEQQGEEEEVEEEQLQCSHCGADRPGPTPTYPWRKHATTGARLCKEFWLYQRKNYGFLPELPLRPAQALQPPGPQAEPPQQQTEPVPQAQHPQDLCTRLLAAARQPAGAVSGLTPELLGSFWAVVGELTPSQQARKVGGGAPPRDPEGGGMHGPPAMMFRTRLPTCCVHVSLQEGNLHLLLERGEYAALVRMMETTVQLALGAACS